MHNGLRFLKNRPRTKLVLIAVLLSILLTGIYCIHRDREIKASLLYFEQILLKANSNEIVFINGQQYEVRGGEIVDGENISQGKREFILRLAYAKIVASRNPIFALPGTDLDKFEFGIEELERTAEKLSDIQDSEIKKFLVRHALYPTGYLLALWRAETERRRFLAEGSDGALKNYSQALHEIQKNYLVDSWQFELAFRLLIPKDGTTYATERHLINRGNSLATLAHLRDVIKKTDDVLTVRSRCLEGRTNYCDQEDLEFSVTEATGEEDYRIDASLLEQIEFYYNSRYSFADEEKVVPPYILLGESTCQSEDIEAIFSLNKHRDDQPVLPMGDVRFVRSADYKEVKFFNKLQQLGLTYVPTGPYSHYTCQTLSVETSLIDAVFDAHDFVVENPVSSVVDKKDSKFEELLSLERSFKNEPIIAESAARAYLRVALSASLPYDIEQKVVDLALQFNNQNSAAADFLLSVVAAENSNLNALRKQIPTNLEAEHLFFSRSGFVSFSLLSLHGFVSERDLFEEINLSREETPYVYFSELLKDGESLDKLINEGRIYSELHSE